VTKVIRQADESIDNLIKRFRTGVTRARIMSAVKRHRFYVPKSEQRQIARRKAVRREKRRQARLARYLRRS
jgi:ribosomal protein S21